VRNLSQEPIETRLEIQLPVDVERSEVAARAAQTISELAGAPHLTDVMLIETPAALTPVEGVGHLEVKVTTAKPLTAAERERLVRETEERLSAQET
jgi:hypothetical protein